LNTTADAHSFVLRIWIEERATATTAGRWRGHITNVVDGRRQSVESFQQIERFVDDYIACWNRATTRRTD
jgi:hypothetical protein